MSPRTDLFIRLLLVVGGSLTIAFLGWWLFGTLVAPGLPAIVIGLFLLIAGGLVLHELMSRHGDRIMGRLFHQRNGGGGRQ